MLKKNKRGFWLVNYAKINQKTNTTMLGFEYEISLTPQYFRDRSKPQEAFNIEEYNYRRQTKIAKTVQKEIILPSRYISRIEGDGEHDCVEIKSCVAPLSYHKQVVRKMIQDETVFNTLRNSERHNNGAIHVHTDMNLEIPVIKKLIEFFYNDDNEAKLFNLSQRCEYSFEEYSRCRPNKFENSWYSPKPHEKALWDTIKQYTSHYQVFNFCNYFHKVRTIEFRLFAAHPKNILPALEFMDCVVAVAKSNTKLTWSTFKEATEEPRYRELNCLITNMRL